MKVSALGYGQIPFLPKLIADYVSSSPALSPFYKYQFDFSAFGKVLSNRKFSVSNRQVLTEAFQKQYEGVEASQSVRKNITLLGLENTFTITTAHQPSLFTGPLYVIYKIISAIHMAEQLCRVFPDKNFVPVYCMGAEDHDFGEINHITLNGERIEWQQAQKGAVGRLSTENILPLISEVETHLQGKPFAEDVIRLLKESYQKHFTLADATMALVNVLFAESGLLVLNPDSRSLKKLFIPVIREEILHQNAFPLAEETNKELASRGYNIQVNPREINLFYLDENIRERIVWNREVGNYEVLNTSLSFSSDEILRLIESAPEHFSPNVMLRPLYQETILPNLAYVGGAGELSYWLQQKKIFEYYNVDFPMLVLRNSALFIDSGAARKIQKTGVELSALFDDEEKMVQDFVKRNSNGFDFSAETKQAEGIFESLRQKAVGVDATLAGAVESQKAAFMKSLETIETKIMRAEKRNFETSLTQLKSVRSKLFPGNVLQERVENFLPYYAQYGKDWLHGLKKEFNPFRKEFLFFTEDN